MTPAKVADHEAPQCQHVSEVGGLQCYLREGHTFGETGRPSPHNYGNCGFCQFTYDPCPYHDPTAHAEMQRRQEEALAKRRAATESLRAGAHELPEWAQDALASVGLA